MVERLKRTPEGISYPKASVTNRHYPDTNKRTKRQRVESDYYGRESVFRQPSTVPKRFLKRITTHTTQITYCNPVGSSSGTLLRCNRTIGRYSKDPTRDTIQALLPGDGPERYAGLMVRRNHHIEDLLNSTPFFRRRRHIHGCPLESTISQSPQTEAIVGP